MKTKLCEYTLWVHTYCHNPKRMGKYCTNHSDMEKCPDFEEAKPILAKSPLQEIQGQWPGDESIDEILSALKAQNNNPAAAGGER